MAKCQWLRERDANIAYLHQLASNRRRNNQINSLVMKEVEILGNDNLQKYVWEYFKVIFRCKNKQWLSFKRGSWEERKVTYRDWRMYSQRKRSRKLSRI